MRSYENISRICTSIQSLSSAVDLNAVDLNDFLSFMKCHEFVFGDIENQAKAASITLWLKLLKDLQTIGIFENWGDRGPGYLAD